MIKCDMERVEASGTKMDLIAEFAVIVRAFYDKGWSKDLLMQITNTCDLDDSTAAQAVVLATVVDMIGNKEGDEHDKV